MPEEQPGLNLGLAAAATLIVGVFGAVGVAGDLLSRMVRNTPEYAALPLGTAIVAVGLFAVIAASRVAGTRLRIVTYVAVVVLTVGLVVAVVVGVSSQTEREHPGVSLNIERAGGQVTLHAKATGTSMRSQERMLVQVVAVRGGSVRALRDRCARVHETTVGAGDIAVVSWTETGPNIKGEAATESKAVAPAGTWTHYCAYAALGDRDESTPKDDRWNWAVVAAPPG